MLPVYFDRNVFADICGFRNNVTQNDIDVIQKAVESKQISILFSSALLAETVAVLQKSDKEFLEQLKTVFSLVDKKKMAKGNDDLLLDDCISFAYLAPFQRTVSLTDYAREFMAAPKINKHLIKLANSHPEAMREEAKRINEAILLQRKKLNNEGKELPSNFIKFWQQDSIKSINKLLDRLPIKEKKLCIKFGVKKMLEIKSIRLYTVHLAWFSYSGLRGVQDKPRKITSSDVLDFIHTIESSAAEILVTQENKDKANKIPYILNQISHKNFRVMSLPEFIEYLKKSNFPKSHL